MTSSTVWITLLASLTASVCVCGYTKVNVFTQPTDLAQPWYKKADGISELPKPLKQHPQNVLPHMELSKATSNDHPHPQLLMQSDSKERSAPLLLLQTQERKKKKN